MDNATRLAAIYDKLYSPLLVSFDEDDMRFVLALLDAEVPARQQAKQERDILYQQLTEADRQPSKATALNAAGRRQFDLRVAAEQERDEAQNARAEVAGNNFALLRKLDAAEQQVTALRAALEHTAKVKFLEGAIAQIEQELQGGAYTLEERKEQLAALAGGNVNAE